MITVDASVVIAHLSPQDPHHQAASAYLEASRAEDLLTHPFPARQVRFTLRARVPYPGYDKSVGDVMARRLVAGRRVGDLESEVLELLWLEADWLSGREVWERLGDELRAYTTVMTILTRLVDKGLVEREVRGRGHVYRAAGDRDELTAKAISSLLAATADPRVALAHFVEGLNDPALLTELAEVLDRVRQS